MGHVYARIYVYLVYTYNITLLNQCFKVTDDKIELSCCILIVVIYTQWLKC